MKYMGSKARFAKDLLSIILKERKESQYYVEPFAGGMNSICEVGDNRIANDINYYLIEMWKELVGGWVPSKITKEQYNDVRVNKQKYPAAFVGWVGFNCSYSGKWFGGFAGETKTKIGTVRDYQNEAINNVLKQAEKLRGVVFENRCYNELILPPNSIIYCDPPYEGTTKYSNNFDHKAFWVWCREQARAGHKIFVSEYSAPSDFRCIWQKVAKSSLSANGIIGGNKISTEKLFTI